MLFQKFVQSLDDLIALGEEPHVLLALHDSVIHMICEFCVQ